jgi:hypothetical protein
MTTQIKRVAGVVNLVAAVVLLGLGVRDGNTAFLVLGVIFLLLGLLRLWQTRSVPPGS